MNLPANDSPSKPLTEAGAIVDIDSVPSTYTGLLDDVMLRYSDDLSEDFFRKMIAKNVLFGGRIFINDGYLVNHPIARRYLVSDGNILRVMINENFVRVLTRAKDDDALAKMPETMAQNGIRSYQQLVAGPDWADFKHRFELIAKKVFRSNNVRKWPNINMSYGYTKLMEGALQQNAQDLGLKLLTDDDIRFLKDRFLNKEPRTGNPRDKFEKAAEEILRVRECYSLDAMREIMNLANQCYHYNFGLAMMESLTEAEGRKAGFAVDTTLGPAFAELWETQPVIPDELDNIPVLRVPQDFPFENGYLFLDFLDDASKIAQAKFRYLHELKRLMGLDIHASYADIQSVRDDIEKATDQYAALISEHISRKHYSSAASDMLGSPLTVAMGRVQDPAKGLIPPDPVMAVQLLEEAKNYSCDFLFRRFRIKGATKESGLEQDEIIRVKDIRPQIASLAFDAEKAKDFTKDLPALV